MLMGFVGIVLRQLTPRQLPYVRGSLLKARALSLETNVEWERAAKALEPQHQGLCA